METRDEVVRVCATARRQAWEGFCADFQGDMEKLWGLFRTSKGGGRQGLPYGVLYSYRGCLMICYGGTGATL